MRFGIIISLLACLAISTAAIAGGKVDRALDAAVMKGGAAPGGLVNVYAKGGKPMVDVFIHADHSALKKIQKLGVHVRTITSSGILTASAPLNKIHAIAALADVSRVEAGKRMTRFMDVSRGATGLNVPGAYPGDTPTGAGVVVGVVDTGLDWSHPDFITDFGATRVYALWDQADYTDGNPPDASKNYGYVYTQDAVQDCLTDVGYCAHMDTDGHGTHVAGTAAGNGRAYGYGSYEHQYTGVAPEATLVIVKFDFDGERNSDTSIVDGIDWIFEKADELGMPAVVNLSLGSDFGPHDGSTLEERGITDLTGAGHIVVAAAGNPGRTGDAPNNELWGYPMHGEGSIPADGYSIISLDVPAYTQGADNYVFFTLWYDGDDTTQVQVVTPSGAAYPPEFKGRSKSTWKTGSPTTYFGTSEGSIIVGNGGDQLGWDTINGDNELYIEISDYGTGNAPAAGTWEIRIFDRGVTNGTYHGWYGTSGNMILSRPWYDGSPTDNTMTVGTPATAMGVIAIAAFGTKMGWEFDDVNGTGCNPCCQTYNDYPNGALSYYDPYFIDENGDGLFSHDFAAGGHPCYLDDPADWAEPFNTLAFFSGQGPSRDNRVKPEVAAPGVGIVASFSQDVADDYFSATNRILADGWHAVLQGTSMACPHGTGAVALLLAEDPGMTPEDVRTILQNTARTDGFTGATPNNGWGYGKLDVSAALGIFSCGSDAECDDGNPCTDDACTDGACVHTPNTAPCADDGNLCTDDVCSGGACVHPANTAACDDGDPCTLNDICGGGTCAGAPKTVCEDNDGCCPDGCTDATDNDCEPVMACGDGYCAGAGLGEDCNTCPADCACVGKDCKNGCCGNGICDKAESVDGCPVDCL